MCMDPRLNSKKFQVDAASATDECQVTPVIHVLQYPGCVPKPIPSFACIGRCASYLQVNAHIPLKKLGFLNIKILNMHYYLNNNINISTIWTQTCLGFR